MEYNYVFITNQFKTGGVESVFLNLANNIGRKIYLLPLHPVFDSFLIEQLPSNVILINHGFNVNSYKKLFLKLILIKQKVKKIIPRNCIVINFSDTFSTLFFSFLIREKKLYSWIHCNPYELKNGKLSFVYFKLLKLCNKLIFICDSQRKLFYEMSVNKKNDKEKGFTITNIIQPEKIIKATTENVELSKKYFLMVARMDCRSKDFFTLIDAYKNLSDDIKGEYNLVFAGDGPDFSLIDSYIKERDLEKNVILLGSVNNPYKYMKNASLYIHSSKAEGFSLVILEALMCGCRIIASDCLVGPNEILDNGAYGKLFVPGNVQELCKCIEDSLKDENYKERNINRAKSLVNKGLFEMKRFFNE